MIQPHEHTARIALTGCMLFRLVVWNASHKDPKLDFDIIKNHVFACLKIASGVAAVVSAATLPSAVNVVTVVTGVSNMCSAVTPTQKGFPCRPLRLYIALMFLSDTIV